MSSGSSFRSAGERVHDAEGDNVTVPLFLTPYTKTVTHRAICLQCSGMSYLSVFAVFRLTPCHFPF